MYITKVLEVLQIVSERCFSSTRRVWALFFKSISLNYDKVSRCLQTFTTIMHSKHWQKSFEMDCSKNRSWDILITNHLSTNYCCGQKKVYYQTNKTSIRDIMTYNRMNDDWSWNWILTFDEIHIRSEKWDSDQHTCTNLMRRHCKDCVQLPFKHFS